MKIFLSFAYDEDIDQVNGFRSMLENPLANISFTDGSCKKDYSGKSEYQIKQYIASLIDNSSVIVCLISGNTRRSSWVGWELEIGKNKNKGIVGIVLKGKNNEVPDLGYCPDMFSNNRYKVYFWNEPKIMQKNIEEAERNR
jgi:hypothetical protein